MTAAKLEYHRKYRESHRDAVRAAYKRWNDKNSARLYYENLELTRAIKRKSYHMSAGNYIKADQEQELINKLRVDFPHKRSGAKRVYSAEENAVRRLASARRAKYKHIEGIPKTLDGFIPPSQCEICGSSRKISMDHCHETHKFRGWLCDNCNVALGTIKENPATMRALADYLEKHKGGH